MPSVVLKIARHVVHTDTLRLFPSACHFVPCSLSCCFVCIVYVYLPGTHFKCPALSLRYIKYNVYYMCNINAKFVLYACINLNYEFQITLFQLN